MMTTVTMMATDALAITAASVGICHDWAPVVKDGFKAKISEDAAGTGDDDKVINVKMTALVICLAQIGSSILDIRME